jgi:hypothetical protein
MFVVNAMRAAPATTGRDPQAVDRHGGAIFPPDNTPSSEPARGSQRVWALHNAAITKLLHDAGRARNAMGRDRTSASRKRLL